VTEIVNEADMVFVRGFFSYSCGTLHGPNRTLWLTRSRLSNMLRQKKLPYMILILDKHSGQAGVNTRFKAFVDSIGW